MRDGDIQKFVAGLGFNQFENNTPKDGFRQNTDCLLPAKIWWS